MCERAGLVLVSAPDTLRVPDVKTGRERQRENALIMTSCHRSSVFRSRQCLVSANLSSSTVCLPPPPPLPPHPCSTIHFQTHTQTCYRGDSRENSFLTTTTTTTLKAVINIYTSGSQRGGVGVGGVLFVGKIIYSNQSFVFCFPIEKNSRFLSDCVKSGTTVLYKRGRCSKSLGTTDLHGVWVCVCVCFGTTIALEYLYCVNTLSL